MNNGLSYVKFLKSKSWNCSKKFANFYLTLQSRDRNSSRIHINYIRSANGIYILQRKSSISRYEKSCISISFRFVYELKISRKKKKKEFNLSLMRILTTCTRRDNCGKLCGSWPCLGTPKFSCWYVNTLHT